MSYTIYFALHFIGFALVAYFGGKIVDLANWHWSVLQIIYVIVLIIIMVSMAFPGLLRTLFGRRR